MRHLTRRAASVMMGFFCLGLLGVVCAPSEPEQTQVLDTEYTGTLDLLLTMDTPPIQATTQMSVDVDRYGNMTIGTGTLSYDGEVTVENESRLRRTGQVTLSPTGSWFDNAGIDQLKVTENGTGQEQYRQWIFDGSDWQLWIDEIIPITWTGGLAFVLDDALIMGSVVESTTTAGTARWTLHLTGALTP